MVKGWTVVGQWCQSKCWLHIPIRLHSACLRQFPHWKDERLGWPVFSVKSERDLESPQAWRSLWRHFRCELRGTRGKHTGLCRSRDDLPVSHLETFNHRSFSRFRCRRHKSKIPDDCTVTLFFDASKLGRDTSRVLSRGRGCGSIEWFYHPSETSAKPYLLFLIRFVPVS